MLMNRTTVYPNYKKKTCAYPAHNPHRGVTVMMKRFPALLILLVLIQATLSESAERIQLAQNTPRTTNRTTKKTEITTSLPPAIISIVTEKEIKGSLSGIRKATVSVDSTKMVVDNTQDIADRAKAALDAAAKAQAANAQAAPACSPTAGVVPVPNVPLPSGGETAQNPAPSGVPPDINAVLSRQRAEELNLSSKLSEELSIVNVPTANLRTMKYIIDDSFQLRGMVYGDEQGYIHILDADKDGNFKEVWKSPPTNSPVRGVYVSDLDNDGNSEIVSFSADGNFFIYGYMSHDVIYRSPEGTYQNINCMVIHNMDSDPQKEIFFIGVKPGSGADTGDPAGNFIQFDISSQFEEWTSSELYTATDMIIGNVDSDPDPELILNTGEIINLQFKDIEWRSTIELGSRLYLVDLDNDGILELVTEYGESHVRIIDVDQRQEKW